jgi:hypothetical protein
MWKIVNCAWSGDDKFWDCTVERNGRKVRGLFYYDRSYAMKIGDKVSLRGE